MIRFLFATHHKTAHFSEKESFSSPVSSQVASLLLRPALRAAPFPGLLFFFPGWVDLGLCQEPTPSILGRHTSLCRHRRDPTPAGPGGRVLKNQRRRKKARWQKQQRRQPAVRECATNSCLDWLASPKGHLTCFCFCHLTPSPFTKTQRIWGW